MVGSCASRRAAPLGSREADERLCPRSLGANGHFEGGVPLVGHLGPGQFLVVEEHDNLAAGPIAIGEELVEHMIPTQPDYGLASATRGVVIDGHE